MQPITGKWDIIQIQNLFYSDNHKGYVRGLPLYYQLLATWLNLKHFNVYVDSYTEYQEPPSTSYPPTTDREFYLRATTDNVKESLEHGMLKWWGTKWLIDQGSTNPLTEQWYPAGKADIYAKEDKKVVECGNTDPLKVFRAFYTSNKEYEIDQFILMPYTHTGLVPQTTLYIFELTALGKANLNGIMKDYFIIARDRGIEL